MSVPRMRFCILGSGSDGNCALLQTPRARVLIDAGFSARRTNELLAGVGESLANIDAVFITHEHGDHASAICGLAKHAQIKVFANRATARVVQAKLKHTPAWQLFETGARFDFLDLQVESFSVPHDAQEPVGFLFTHHGNAAPENNGAARSVAWLTDLGHTPRHIHERIRNAEVLVVEANHCPEMLQADKRRPWSTKQRISGRHGHLSNHAVRELLESVESPAWRQIYLTHLSRECNSAEAIQRALDGIDAKLRCPFAIVPPGESTMFYEFA
ncbi:MBL fold metallo-hydrolase [Ereboglobus luteus]|nr:MBL fold metallo-hydrolase [Ereboglobus luteus]